MNETTLAGVRYLILRETYGPYTLQDKERNPVGTVEGINYAGIERI